MKLFMKLLKNFVAGELRQVVAKLEVVLSCSVRGLHHKTLTKYQTVLQQKQAEVDSAACTITVLLLNN